MARLVVDPVTRVSGHLRLEVDVADGAVRDAWAAGTMFRGVERLLLGRDPRDAWLLAQRICGSCTGVHALASVRAVENALDITIPPNARLVRNLLAGTQNVADHVAAFYGRQAFDWVDVVAALDADPAATGALARSISPWPEAGGAYFAGMQERVRRLVQAGQPGPLANGPWGHPAYTMPPEANLLIVAHALEALDWQRRFMRMHTLLGGKSPHPQTFLVGGMALVPPWGGPTTSTPGEHPAQVEREAPVALGPRGLELMAQLIDEAKRFVEQVLVPDVLLVAAQYRDAWATVGAGPGSYLAFGEFPEDDGADPALLLPRGRILARQLGRVEPVDQARVGESVAHAHYADDAANGATRHPWDATTDPSYQGPPPPVTTLEGSTRYSWVKAARYEDEPMEVGALARLLVGYVEARGEARASVRRAAEILGGGPEVLFGTLGRIVAGALEAQLVVGRLDGWRTELEARFADGDLAVATTASWGPGSWPSSARGWSLGESPRGAVGHWVSIRDGLVDEYQVVDAGTWNASPRDGRDRPGACEAALVGTPVADPARPLEILRVVHSFDPCPACAVHAVGGPGADTVEIHLAHRRAR
jgi:hydrogenase large subunit